MNGVPLCFLKEGQEGPQLIVVQSFTLKFLKVPLSHSASQGLCEPLFILPRPPPWQWFSVGVALPPESIREICEGGFCCHHLPLRGLEGIPGLPGASQDEAVRTRKFEMSHGGQHAGEKRGVAGLLLGRTERAARAAELQLCAQAR